MPQTDLSGLAYFPSTNPQKSARNRTAVTTTTTSSKPPTPSLPSVKSSKPAPASSSPASSTATLLDGAQSKRSFGGKGKGLLSAVFKRSKGPYHHAQESTSTLSSVAASSIAASSQPESDTTPEATASGSGSFQGGEGSEQLGLGSIPELDQGAGEAPRALTTTKADGDKDALNHDGGTSSEAVGATALGTKSHNKHQRQGGRRTAALSGGRGKGDLHGAF